MIPIGASCHCHCCQVQSKAILDFSAQNSATWQQWPWSGRIIYSLTGGHRGPNSSQSSQYSAVLLEYCNSEPIALVFYIFTLLLWHHEWAWQRRSISIPPWRFGLKFEHVCVDSAGRGGSCIWVPAFVLPIPAITANQIPAEVVPVPALELLPAKFSHP